MANTINELSPLHSKTEVAKQLGISRSRLYYQSKLYQKDMRLKYVIEAVMEEHKSYGHKRIALALKMNKKRILRVMKKFHLRPEKRRKKMKKPLDTKQQPTGIPNLIKDSIIERKNQIWVSDFTYLSYFGRFVYLATIEDIFTREVIGWHISMRHNTDLVSQALLQAVGLNEPAQIIHSDQGSEYRSKAYVNLLHSLDIKPSMSRKASPWENGYQESFYSGFKLDFNEPETYLTYGELTEAIARQIYYYNNQRIHTALKCPPAVFSQCLSVQKSIKQPCFNQLTREGQLV